jgi:SAM-dependent methyltransferase
MPGVARTESTNEPPRGLEKTESGSGASPSRSQVGPRDRLPAHLEPGSSTAVRSNVAYRLGKLESLGLLHGEWLDCGCADGGYTLAMLEHGVQRVVGVDIEPDRVEQARARALELGIGPDKALFKTATAAELPLSSGAFDGVLLNEVLEHVGDEAQTLREVMRVLRPGGRVVVISPNRWFPFEGHGMRMGRRSLGFPVPFLPWVPSRLSMRFMTARNYWPGELRSIVRRAGFQLYKTAFVLPVFEVYPWLPAAFVRWYRKNLPRLDRNPIVARFGVSNLVVGVKPAVDGSGGA